MPSFLLPIRAFIAPRKRVLLVLLAGILFLLLVTATLFLPTFSFPKGERVRVSSGESISAVGNELQQQKIIHSVIVFKVLMRLFDVLHIPNAIPVGDYAFSKPMGVLPLALRLSRGDYGISPVKITFPEGYTVQDMTLELAHVPDVSTTTFLNLAQPSEGYLFPNTYFVQPGTDPDLLVRQMKHESSQALTRIAPEIKASGHSEEEIVILASILEREAKTTNDRRVIAGILWKRISHGIPLAVDAAFGYAHAENGYTPTAHDLVTDGPYNTYMRLGLPPTPISNPGLDALTAAATPLASPYLYYLTGDDGRMHYAATYAEHLANTKRYLGR